MIGTDAFQETPIVEVTRQITKHNYLVMDVRDLPRIVKEVCRLNSECILSSASTISRIWGMPAGSHACSACNRLLY